MAQQETIQWLGQDGRGPARITRRSPLSGLHTMDLDITPTQWDLWQQGGVLIQNCFPQLTANEREFIQTGYTPSDWAKIFPEAE